MGLNDTVSAERVQIGFFGVRNAGKSSVVNAVCGQALSLVSDVLGTTTDPVTKSMELLPIGPVVVTDTPGIDDEGALGEMRVKRALRILEKTDLAVLVADAAKGLCPADRALLGLFGEKKLPYVIAFNKADLLPDVPRPEDENVVYVSAKTGFQIDALKELIAKTAAVRAPARPLVRDLFGAGDTVVLVTPIDAAAPKGRIILPQQQVLRDVLDGHGIAIVVQEPELGPMLASLPQKPQLVITDSQAFGRVSAETPAEVLLTSFSILFARYKGTVASAVQGAVTIDRLCDGDTVLISEGCTHHRQCGDIGTVKLPHWLEAHTGKRLNYRFSSGKEFPEALDGVKLVIHCGACMLNEKEMRYRTAFAKEHGIPMTNYGIAIAHLHGILRRSLSPFPELQALL